MEYFVVDVETANQARNSICQIGIAHFRHGQYVEGWQSLVNPEGEFSIWNIRVHGIKPAQVVDSPTWAQVYPEVRARLHGAIVASHTNFDQAAVGGACLRDGLPSIVADRWLDTCGLAREAFPNTENHKLTTLARHFGIMYQAHDALEDARAAGEILSLALEAKQTTLEELLVLPGSFLSSFCPAVPRPERPRASRTKSRGAVRVLSGRNLGRE